MVGKGLEALTKDLRFAFGFFSLQCLLHVQANQHRLIRGRFTSDGKGCLFYLLSETLPAAERITTPATLTRFFTGGSGFPYCEEPHYQPARWLVRAIDGDYCERYGGAVVLEWSIVLQVLDDVIKERTTREQEAAVVEREALHRLSALRCKAAVGETIS